MLRAFALFQITFVCLAVATQTCLKKLVMVKVAGLKPVRLHDSSPLVVLSKDRLPMMLEFRRSDHEPFLSAQNRVKMVVTRPKRPQTSAKANTKMTTWHAQALNPEQCTLTKVSKMCVISKQ